LISAALKSRPTEVLPKISKVLQADEARGLETGLRRPLGEGEADGEQHRHDDEYAQQRRCRRQHEES